MDKTIVTADILTEFLEVAIHFILYTRQLYPLNIFEKRKKYNVPVQMSVHPVLNQYIQNVIDGIHLLLSQHHVEKISVVVCDSKSKPLEKFIFEVKVPDSTNEEIKDQYLLRLEQALRAFCLKISICDSYLAPLPEDCSFSVQVHTNESTALSLDIDPAIQSFPWVEAEPNQVVMQDSNIIPLKSFDHELLSMQLYVEETSHKH